MLIKVTDIMPRNRMSDKHFFALLTLACVCIGILVVIKPLLALVISMGLVGLLGLAIFVQHPHWLFYLLAFFIPYQMEISLAQLFGVRLSPNNILCLILTFILVLKLISNHHISVIPLFSVWVIYVLMCIISRILGPTVTGLIQGTWSVYRTAIMASLIYISTCMFLTDTKHIRKTFAILVVSASLSSIIAVIQTVSHGQILSGLITNMRYLGFLQPLTPEVVKDAENLVLHLMLGNTFRGHGTFYTANGLGALLCVAAGLTWGLYRSARRKRKFGWLLALVCQLAGLIVTFSRSAWAALIIGLAFAIFVEVTFIKGKHTARRRIQLFLLVGVVLLVGAIFLSRSTDLSSRFTSLLTPWKVHEFQWRLELWTLAVEKLQTRPWIGFGTPTVRTLTTKMTSARELGAHNLFVGVAYESGVIALVAFLFFVWKFFHWTWQWFKYAATQSEQLFVMGVLAAGASFFVSGSGSALMNIDNLAMLFWLMIGIAVNMKNKSKHNPTTV